MPFKLDADVAQCAYVLSERAHEGEPPGRELEHARKPYVSATPEAISLRAAQELVAAYLGEAEVSAFFKAPQGAAAHLARTVGKLDPEIGRRGAGLRWREPIVVRRRADGSPETISVIIQQTFFPDWLGPVRSRGSRGQLVVPDVWGGGVRALVHTRPLRVTSACSTLAHDVAPAEPGGGAQQNGKAFRPTLLGPRRLAAKLSILLGYDHVLRIEPFSPPQLLIYRFNPEDLRSAPPIPAEEVEQAADYLVEGVHIRIKIQEIRPGEPGHSDEELVYRAFLRKPDDEQIYLRLLGSHLTHGQVFRQDPVSQSGLTVCEARGPVEPLPPLPHDPSECLNAHRSSAPLLELDPPGPNNELQLKGPLAKIVSPNPLGVDPPREPDGGSFDYDARTADFAAVNAYYHFDRMVRVVEELGFDRKDYFAADQFPLAVLHYSGLFPTPCHDGRCINAQVLPDPREGSRRVHQVRLALGDLMDWGNPLGIATDPRWLWHEFCHVLLQASTDEMEFSFCHSAGDALAAIMSDPDSALADAASFPPHRLGREESPRGITFPFVWRPLRRHDRRAADGWGWFGAMHQPDDRPDERDPGGYRAEEIMASTLFRLYRALGGDAASGGAPDRARRAEAARRTAYLIVAAIRALGPARATPAKRVGAFVAALAAADLGGSPPSPAGGGGVGGCLHKVVRWAFQEQGHFQAPGAPWPQNKPGEPCAVDVGLDDGDGGYAYRKDWRAPASAFWVRRTRAAAGPSLTARDEEPRPLQRNFVYARIRNFGSEDARNVDVQVYAASGAAIDAWPVGWTRLRRGAGSFPRVIRAGAAAPFGPFIWSPPRQGPVALLCVATAKGDRSNLDKSTQLPCALASGVPLADVAPYDNNLGYRSWRRLRS